MYIAPQTIDTRLVKAFIVIVADKNLVPVRQIAKPLRKSIASASLPAIVKLPEWTTTFAKAIYRADGAHRGYQIYILWRMDFIIAP